MHLSHLIPDWHTCLSVCLSAVCQHVWCRRTARWAQKVDSVLQRWEKHWCVKMWILIDWLMGSDVNTDWWLIDVFRCDGHHLRGSEQQLQHGDQRGQLHQSAARISGPLQIHLDQQVHYLTLAALWLAVMNPLCSLIGCSWPSLLSDWLQISEDHLSDLVSEQTGRSRWQDSGWKIQTGGLFPRIQQLPSPSRMYKYTQRYAHMYKYTIAHLLTSVYVCVQLFQMLMKTPKWPEPSSSSETSFW